MQKIAKIIFVQLLNLEIKRLRTLILVIAIAFSLLYLRTSSSSLGKNTITSSLNSPIYDLSNKKPSSKHSPGLKVIRWTQSPKTTTLPTTISSTTTTRKIKCPSEPQTLPINHDITPKFQTQPDKYILPSLLWGPSNQLLGLRESIALAIKFNRTLILPKLYRHFSDPESSTILQDYNDVIDPSLRLSVTKLRELIPVVFISEVKDICPNGPDAIWPARETDLKQPRLQIRYVHMFDVLQNPKWYLTDYAKLNLTGPMNVAHEKLNQYPVPKIDKWPYRGKVYPVLGDVDGQENPNWADPRWMSVYGDSNEKCVVRNFPMGSLVFWKGADKEHNIDARDMYHMTARHTAAPEYIDKLIEMFKTDQETSSENSNVDTNVIEVPLSLSVHWRFDKNDWLKGPINKCENIKFKNNETACAVLNQAMVEPAFISRAVLKYASDVISEVEKDHKWVGLDKFGIDLHSKAGDKVVINPLEIYISGPPAEADFVGRISDGFKRHVKEYNLIKSVKTITSKELQNWYKENYLDGDCDWIRSNWYEIGSLMEQRLCEEATIFLVAYFF